MIVILAQNPIDHINHSRSLHHFRHYLCLHLAKSQPTLGLHPIPLLEFTILVHFVIFPNYSLKIELHL